VRKAKGVISKGFLTTDLGVEKDDMGFGFCGVDNVEVFRFFFGGECSYSSSSDSESFLAFT
jgi:hypothetical protein